MTTPRANARREAICISPCHASGMSISSLTSPASPKSAQVRAPVRVERDNAQIVGAGENARADGCLRRRLRVHPIGHAAAIVAIAGTLGFADLGIEAPLLRAGSRVERDHLVEGRAQDQAVLDEQRRRLELGAGHELGIAPR